MKSTVMLLLVACTGKSAPPTETMECEPDELLGCFDANTALRCNADGTNSVHETCAATCNEAAGRCNACVPSTSACAGSSVETCGADGQVASTESCAAGCADEGTAARCKHVVPVWIPDACDVAPALAVRGFTGMLDTSNAAACDRVIQQKLPTGEISGPEICVVGARTIQIGAFKVIGSRAIAFVGDDVTVDGLLDVTADGTRNGPGVFLTNGEFDTFFGGGGAGFKQRGAAGGGDEFGGNARQGGAIRDPLVEPVFSGGTRPGDDSGITAFDDPVVGGAGGGAIIVACRGTAKVATNGIIDAGGGGGMRGTTSHGGAGGGSGGYVVIQGTAVTVTGRLYVNGGGGGATCASGCLPGADAFGFAGGTGEGGLGGHPGGAGGKGDQAAQPGVNQQSGTTGGGGGSVGRIQVYTPAGVTPVLTPLEPLTFEPNRTINVR